MAFESLRPDNFSYEGLSILFDWLEQLEQDTGEELELDVIAICCDFSQCSLREFSEAFGLDSEPNDLIDNVIKYVESNGAWYELFNDDQEIIFQNF